MRCFKHFKNIFVILQNNNHFNTNELYIVFRHITWHYGCITFTNAFAVMCPQTLTELKKKIIYHALTCRKYLEHLRLGSSHSEDTLSMSDSSLGFNISFVLFWNTKYFHLPIKQYYLHMKLFLFQHFHFETGDV